MDKIVLEENIRIEKSTYKDQLDEFNLTLDKEKLINKYKNHNMRFSVIIDRNIAIENNDLEFASFLDSVINDMTHEISLLNKSMLNGNIDEALKKLTFHEKVNIIFYVRPNFYDSEFEPYEILTEDTFKQLSNSIIGEANSILVKYNKKLNKIIVMNPKNIHNLINNNELELDILYASELIK